MRTLRRRPVRRRALLALLPLALVAAACGSGGGTVTVGDGGVQLSGAPPPLPPAPHLVVTGPGAVHLRLSRRGYSLAFRISPNRPRSSNRIAVAVSRDGAPVRGARVSLAASMLTMDMGVARYELKGGGAYAVKAPAWLMAGRWQLDLEVRPPGERAIRVSFDDRMR
jgi:hypothetical protein